MGNIGAVVCVVLGMCLVLFLGLASACIWGLLEIRKQQTLLRVQQEVLASEQQKHRDEMVRVLESGRSQFQNIRAENKNSMDIHIAEIRETLKMFEDGFRAALRNLNGKAMLEASKQNVAALKRLESVSQVLHELVISANSKIETGLADEEYAPEGEASVPTIYDAQKQYETEIESEFNRVTGGLFT